VGHQLGEEAVQSREPGVPILQIAQDGDEGFMVEAAREDLDLEIALQAAGMAQDQPQELDVVGERHDRRRTAPGVLLLIHHHASAVEGGTVLGYAEPYPDR
jgi:hypothetical protein